MNPKAVNTKAVNTKAGAMAIETEQGILLPPFDPTVQEALALASEAARQFQPALRELAQ
jgi:hypothetical protein